MSLQESDKFARRQDADRVERFNSDVKNWAIHVTGRLRQNVRAVGIRDKRLSKSIHPNLYYDSRYGTKEVYRISFGFVREGIYIHKGAGKGMGGFRGGSKWYNLHGDLKETASKSLGKMGSGNRRPKEWFDPVIRQELPALADIVASYSASLQIDATSIFID